MGHRGAALSTLGVRLVCVALHITPHVGLSMILQGNFYCLPFPVEETEAESQSV